MAERKLSGGAATQRAKYQRLQVSAHTGKALHFAWVRAPQSFNTRGYWKGRSSQLGLRIKIENSQSQGRTAHG